MDQQRVLSKVLLLVAQAIVFVACGTRRESQATQNDGLRYRATFLHFPGLRHFFGAPPMLSKSW